MYEVPDVQVQDYRQKWFEAERDLAIHWAESLYIPVTYEPIDNIDKDTEPISELPSTSRKLEDDKSGTTRAQVFSALKTVVKAPKQLSVKCVKRPICPPSPTSGRGGDFECLGDTPNTLPKADASASENSPSRTVV